MAQAVPWYGPPREALNSLSDRLSDPLLHRYSPDQGLLSARKALVAEWKKRRNLDLDADNELHLTCGASQAFISALLAVTDPGDRIILIEPYYFDHLFAIQFSSLRPQIISMGESEGWHFPWDELLAVIKGARALVLVNPGNPTGAVLSQSELRQLVALTEAENCMLIVDETYESFNFSGSPWHPWQEQKKAHVISLGSFSKSFGIAGWRLGYLFAQESIMMQALKVQDSISICAPVPAQILLEECLKQPNFLTERSREVEQRLSLCREALNNCRGLDWRDAGGGFFTLAACPGRKSDEVATILLQKYGIGTIPGRAFGNSGECHVRISFGCLEDDQLEPAMNALSRVVL